MHLRSLVPGVVSRRVGCEVMMEKRMEEGGFGNSGGGGGGEEACVFSVADPRRFLKNWLLQSTALGEGTRGLAAHQPWQQSVWGASRYICFLRDTASSPVHPQSSSKNTSRGWFSGEARFTCKRFYLNIFLFSQVKPLGKAKKVSVFQKPFCLSSIFGFPSTHDPKIFTGPGWNMKSPDSSICPFPKLSRAPTSSLAYQYHWSSLRQRKR